MTFNPTAVDLTALPWLPLEETSAFPATRKFPMGKLKSEIQKSLFLSLLFPIPSRIRM